MFLSPRRTRFFSTCSCYQLLLRQIDALFMEATLPLTVFPSCQRWSILKDKKFLLAGLEVLISCLVDRDCISVCGCPTWDSNPRLSTKYPNHSTICLSNRNNGITKSVRAQDSLLDSAFLSHINFSVKL